MRGEDDASGARNLSDRIEFGGETMKREMTPAWEITDHFFGDLPVISNGLVLVPKLIGTKWWLTALALESGARVWQIDPGGGAFAPRFAVAGNVLYLAASPDRTEIIRSIDLGTQAQHWTRMISPSWRHFGPAELRVRDDALVAFADNGTHENVVYV